MERAAHLYKTVMSCVLLDVELWAASLTMLSMPRNSAGCGD